MLRRYLALREENPAPYPKRDLLRIVLNELVENFWLPSKIPTKDTNDCLRQLQTLIDEYVKLMKYSIARRHLFSTNFEEN